MSYTNILSNAYRWFTDPYRFLDEARARQGLTFRVALPGMGSPLLTGDPVLIREILAEPRFEGGRGIQIMRALFGGETLIMLHGEPHRARRRLLMPHFHEADLARFDDLTTQTALAVLRRQPAGQAFSAYEFAREVTATVIVRLVFGALPPGEEADVLGMIHAYMTSFRSPLVLFLRPLHIDLGPASAWGRFLRNRERLRGFVRARVRAFHPSDANAGSILAALCASGGLAEDDLVTELFSLLMFGHDTTSVTLAWAFAHIYSHPATLARLQADPAPAFLRACLDESMRLSPAVVQLFRVAGRDLRLGGETIRSGEMIMPCLYLAHHNPQVFPEPERYLPERFLQGEPPPHTFFPFGFGARLCLGKALAERQMPLILAAALTQARLRLAPGYQPAPERYMLFIAPRAGCRMVKEG